jgi:hypothetical protein
LLRRTELDQIWLNLRQFPQNINNRAIRIEANDFVQYIDNQWINNRGPPNIWNFNRLAIAMIKYIVDYYFYFIIYWNFPKMVLAGTKK